jgi:hypothetical protein
MNQITMRHMAALQIIWENTRMGSKENKRSFDFDTNHVLSACGRNTEETLKFLYTNQPTFDAFCLWLSLYPATDVVIDDNEQTLTVAQLNFWNKNGYIVINNAISKTDSEATRTAIWNFLEADPNEPETWYKPHPAKNGMMLSYVHHPTLDNNRYSAKIRKIYSELYGHNNIYLQVDKVSYNPPVSEKYRFMGSPLHWDVSIAPPIPEVFQGLLYLNDVEPSDGAFHCVPGFHHKINEWLSALPEGADARAIAVEELNPIAIPGKAGDLVIWHHALPHCATPNTGTLPRMVQYIAWKPIGITENKVWR